MLFREKRVDPVWKLADLDEFYGTRPSVASAAVANHRSSVSYQPQPSRRTSYSAYGPMSTPPHITPQPSQSIPPHPNPLRERQDSGYTRETSDSRDNVPRGESNGESSSVSSNGQYNDDVYAPLSVPYAQSVDSPPLTPRQFQPTNSRLYQSYGLPSPEPELEYPRHPPKPVATFVNRPATPPDEKPKKVSKWKRFSGMGKNKA
jgi:hypothetical protein